MELAGRVAALLDAAGLDLRGALSRDDYDAQVPPAWQSAQLLPDACSALVIGSGGRALWRAAQASGGLASSPHPLDAHTERALVACVETLRGAGEVAVAVFAHERRGDAYADFVALARAAGLGAPSRLGLLVHPVYGPWLSLRAVLLSRLPWPVAGPLAGFDPCRGCPAPCASACHGDAVDARGFAVARCAATRARDARCALRCDARHACVLGQEHAYLPEAEAHHMRHVQMPVVPCEAQVESRRTRT
jgi:hypothetical protein